MLASGTIASYVTSYMTTYALDTLHMQATIAFGVVIVNGIVLGDVRARERMAVGQVSARKPVMLVPGVVLLLSILPSFWIISHYRTTFTFYAAMAWLSAFDGASTRRPSSPLSSTRVPAQKHPLGRAGHGLCFRDLDLRRLHAGHRSKRLIDVTHNPLAPAYY